MKNDTRYFMPKKILLSALIALAISHPLNAELIADNLSGTSSMPPAGGADWIDESNRITAKNLGNDIKLVIDAGSQLIGHEYSDRTYNKDSTILISGIGSLFKMKNYALFGIEDSSGHVIISQGGLMDVGGHIYISGYRDGSDVVVTDSGSTMKTSWLELGNAGNTNKNITLTLSNGGTLDASRITVQGSGAALNIGSLSGQNAVSAGYVNAPVITLARQGSIIFNHTDNNYNFSPDIDGAGNIKVESGKTVLTGKNSYTGITSISNGQLVAGSEGSLSTNSSYEIGSNGSLELDGYSQAVGNITNAGLISLAGAQAGTILTVKGDYSGNNGIIVFGTKLGDDRAISDRLVVTGDVTGTTSVRVTNLGGSGAETLNGIELIEVQGNADSNAFTQQGRIVAGAYDYKLVRGDRNWYLTNRENMEAGLPITPGNGGENPGGGGGENPGGGGGENPGGGGGEGGGGENPGGGSGGGGGENPGGGESVMVLRPEGGAYAANLSTASTLFDTRMSDRQGTYYLDPVTGEEKHTSLWLRMSGNHNRLNDGGGQLRTRANSFVTLLGGDVAASDTARLGVMAGYGNSKSNTRSDITGYRAKGQINGYTTGVYGTWFAEGTDEKGLWADSTLQYSWFDNTVDGEDEAGESYKSKGLSASLSTGYVIPLGEGERTAFFLQPQARVGWSGLKADDHTESNGTLVQSSGQDNVSSSIGVKAFVKGNTVLNDKMAGKLGAFIEANWIHNTREYGVRLDDVDVSQSGSQNIAEVRVGLDGALVGGFNVKGTVGHQIGNNGWSDTAATIGIKYHF